MRIIKFGQGTIWRIVGGIRHPLCARDGIFAMSYVLKNTTIHVDVIRVAVKDGDTMIPTDFELDLRKLGSGSYMPRPNCGIYVIKTTVFLIFTDCVPTKIYVYDVIKKNGGIEAMPYAGNPIVTQLKFPINRHFLDNEGNYYELVTEMTQDKQDDAAVLKVTSIKKYKIMTLKF
jgi:hypothetical protein